MTGGLAFLKVSELLTLINYRGKNFGKKGREKKRRGREEHKTQYLQPARVNRLPSTLVRASFSE